MGGVRLLILYSTVYLYTHVHSRCASIVPTTFVQFDMKHVPIRLTYVARLIIFHSVVTTSL